ncbi:MAG: peptidoglycan-binding protein, partial [Gemmobacter sp.]
MMRLGLRFAAMVLAVGTLLVAQGAAAQTRWIQIEAQPSEREALARLEAWSGAFPDVSAYALTTGWFG